MKVERDTATMKVERDTATMKVVTRKKKKIKPASTAGKIKKTIFLRQSRTFHLVGRKDHKDLVRDRLLKKFQVPAYETIQREDGVVLRSYDHYAKGLGLNDATPPVDDDGPPLVKMLPYPSRRHLTVGFTNAIWKSHLFFISGRSFVQRTCDYTHSVFSFNTQEQIWDGEEKWEPIQQPRCGHVAVVTDNRIYVFGDLSGKHISDDHWGELFNITENKWNYLPSPPTHLYKLGRPRAYAVYRKCQAFNYITQYECNNLDRISYRCVDQNHTLILFPLPNSGGSSPISIFDCTANEWLPNLYPQLPPHAPPIFPHDILYLHDQLAIIDGVLLWHHGHAIHGYDFLSEINSKAKFLPELYKIPPYGCPECCDFHDRPPVFLVQPEDDKLFLIFQYTCDKHTVHCCEFLVQLRQHGQPGPRLSLLCQSYSSPSTKSMGHTLLQDVLLLED